jgi:tetratricopeptide (TPR) repeat protein
MRAFARPPAKDAATSCAERDAMIDAATDRARRATLALCAAIVVASCAQQPTAPPASPAGTATPAPTTAPGTPPAAPQPSPPATAAPAPAPAPVDPAVARPQAAKLALEAVDQLQNGDETAARGTLERALALDPANDLARKLMDQIRADAQKELGPVFFRYTVQPADTLSRLAQQYMGDRFRFYILAKYNDIANPSRLSAGQVIRIPGREPPKVAAPEPPAAPAPPPPVAAPEQKPRDEYAEVLAKGSEMEKAGNLEGAFTFYTDAAQRYPANGEFGKRRDAVKLRLVSTYDREATQAFQRQNLDLAISKWDRILEIDPQNRKARLERERALDLKKRMAQKFGTK